MSRFMEKVLSRYSGRSYELRGRVKTILYLFIIFIVIFLAIAVLMNIVMQRHVYDSFNIIMATFIAVDLLGILLIYTGRYYSAVNIFIIAVVAGLIFNSYGTMLKGSAERYLASLIPLSGTILFASFFCSFRVFMAIVLFEAATYAFFILNFPVINPEMRGVILVDLLINLAFSSILCSLSLRINYTARTMRREERERERGVQIEINRNLLQSMKDVSAELDTSSFKMSDSTETFSRNLGDQAASIEEITATMEEIEGGSESLSSGAIEQSQAIKKLLSKMEELSGITKEIEKKVSVTLTRTKNIAGRAESGEGFIRDMNESMSSIRTTSQEMTGIAGMISDISDKINLLSLNASIEAARAGEAGRGFAVVADEVSKLADQTSSSVKEIDRLIKKSEGEIERGMSKVQDTVSVINEVIAGVNEINLMMGSLNSHMDSYLVSHGEVNREAEFVKRRSDEIRGASDEQKKAAEDTTRTLSGINELSQSNSSWAEEMSVLSKMIAARAKDINEKITSFDLSSLESDENVE
jgi:methyl-accepting chemotaxis protein